MTLLRHKGKWGRLHREYLKTEHPVLFNDHVLSGRLWTYLADLNEQAQERMFLIVEQMKAVEDVTFESNRPDGVGQSHEQHPQPR